MRQIQRLALDLEGQTKAYDPLFCKTCQKLGVEDAEPARTLFSDCEKHYQKRVKNLRRTGVTIL